MSYENEMLTMQDGSIESQNLGLAHELSERSKAEKVDHFERLIETGIPPATAQQLDIMLTSDLTLSYLETAGVNELRWIGRIFKELVYTVHPPVESIMQGAYRAFLMDDEEDTLTALGGSDKLIISEIMSVIETRISRSTRGWQQDELSKTMVVSETKRMEDTKKSQRKGLFK